jgi:hypothetical protein
MADYYPLLARALDALPDRSPGLRRAVYDRARNALVSQLRSLEPPLSEDDIDLERRALDTAIERLEVEHGGIPAPANDAPSPKEASPRDARPEVGGPSPAGAPSEERREVRPVEAEPPPPPAPEPISPPVQEPAPSRPPDAPLPEPVPASRSEQDPAPQQLPLAPSPRFNLKPEAANVPPRAAAIPITAPKTQPESDLALLSGLGLGTLAGSEGSGASDDAAAGADVAQGRQRPRIEVVAPRGRSRILRNLAIGIVLIAVIGAIAVAAFLLRDTPQALVRSGSDATQQAPDGSAETKFGDRVGSEVVQPPPADRLKPRQEETPANPPAAAAPARTSVAVAQQAVLIEESTAPDSAQPITSQGRVTWRIDTANGDQGQPLQTMAVAVVNYPDAGLSMTMTIRKNLDATLPASHTVSLAFSQSGPEAASRIVQDVGLLQAKDDESSRGSPVSGLPVRVRDNLFLIGLSSLPADVERNIDLLTHRNWFDVAVRYTGGRRAVLTFEKGQSGNQVIQQAIEAWK